MDRERNQVGKDQDNKTGRKSYIIKKERLVVVLSVLIVGDYIYPPKNIGVSTADKN